jgi:hypothetical protein
LAERGEWRSDDSPDEKARIIEAASPAELIIYSNKSMSYRSTANVNPWR